MTLVSGPTHVCAPSNCSAVDAPSGKDISMMFIGIDSHKDHLAACLIEETGRAVEHRLIGNTSRGHAELAAWAQHLGVGQVAVEGSGLSLIHISEPTRPY